MQDQKTKKRYRHYNHFQGGETSVQFACFQCRKIFKRKVSFKRGETEGKICSQCREPIWFTGTAFKAPRQEEVKQWRKAELLIKNGVLFHSNCGYRPKVLREVAPFLKRVKLKSVGEISLGKLSKAKTSKTR